MAELHKLNVRFTEIFYGRIVTKAKQDGASVNEWIVEACRLVLDGAVEPHGMATQARSSMANLAADLANRFPGSNTQVGLAEPEAEAGDFVVVDEARRDADYWRRKFPELREMPSDEAMRELNRLCGGVKIPRSFYRPGAEKELAAWLAENAKGEL